MLSVSPHCQSHSPRSPHQHYVLDYLSNRYKGDTEKSGILTSPNSRGGRKQAGLKVILSNIEIINALFNLRLTNVQYFLVIPNGVDAEIQEDYRGLFTLDPYIFLNSRTKSPSFNNRSCSPGINSKMLPSSSYTNVCSDL